MSETAFRATGNRRPAAARGGKRRAPTKMTAATRRRRGPQGATRNAPPTEARSSAKAKAPRRPSAWVNRLLILLGAAVVLAAATRGFVTIQSLPVLRISVSGELERTQAERVQDMVQPALAGGFLMADLHEIRRQLESLPWIYEATVRRKWPNALEIHVVEELPIARWGRDGFLNHHGEIFHSDKGGDLASLPQLDGPPGSAQALMQEYLRMVEALGHLNLAVEQLSIDARGQIEVVLAGGTQLHLGGKDFRDRMQRFARIYRGELSARWQEVERVDLRYEDGVAVAYRTSDGSESARVAGL